MKELWPLEENKYKWSNVASIYHKINDMHKSIMVN